MQCINKHASNRVHRNPLIQTIQCINKHASNRVHRNPLIQPKNEFSVQMYQDVLYKPSYFITFLIHRNYLFFFFIYWLSSKLNCRLDSCAFRYSFFANKDHGGILNLNLLQNVFANN